MVKEAEKKELLKRHADKNAIKVISYEWNKFILRLRRDINQRLV
jgi:hypothetical protein